MEVYLKSQTKRTKKKLMQPLQWYDTVEKKMLSWTGGKLNFKYDVIEKRVKPFVEDMEVIGYQNNYDEVLSWVKKNEDNLDIEILETTPGHFVLIDVEPERFMALSRELYNARIMFEYEPKDLRAVKHAKDY